MKSTWHPGMGDPRHRVRMGAHYNADSSVTGRARSLRPAMQDAASRGDGDSMSKVVSPAAVAAGLTELWSPRVVASLDDSYVKVAKVHGTFGWHAHDDEDELFYVLAGHLRIEMADGAVELDAGDAYVVPKGVRHNPVAEQECLVMLIERKTTLHTGSEINEHTRSLADQLRAV